MTEQWYRLAHWRVADEELNYRRFFDVDTLAAVRVENQEVFEATHELLFSLLHEGKLTASGSITRTAWPTRAATCVAWPSARAVPG